MPKIIMMELGFRDDVSSKQKINKLYIISGIVRSPYGGALARKSNRKNRTTADTVNNNQCAANIHLNVDFR